MNDERLHITAGTLYRLANIIAAFAALSVLALALIFLFYSQPRGDDFARAAIPISEIFTYIRHMYVSWSGRWTSLALEVTGFSVFSPTQAYWGILLTLLLVYVAALYAFLSTILGRGSSWRLRAWFSLLLMALIWTSVPEPGWTLYWTTGGIENHLPTALALLLFSTVVAIPPRETAGREAAVGIALGAVAIFITGLHELAAVVLQVVLVTGAAVAFRVRHPKAIRWALLCVVAGIGASISILAPGNEVRASQLPLGGDPVRAVAVTLELGRNYLGSWILDPKLLSLTLYLTLHPTVRRVQPHWLQWNQVPWRTLVPGVALLLLSIGFVAPSWTLGASMPPRTANGLYTLFLISWFMTTFVWTRKPLGARALSPSAARFLCSCSLLILAFGYVWNDNTRSAKRDLASRLIPWHAAMDGWFEIARSASAAGEGEVVLPAPAAAEPELLPGDYVTAEPARWENRAFGAYFGLQRVSCRASRCPEASQAH